ncbi:ligand-binding protein SH3, partial [Corynebacterium bovis]
MTRISPGGGMPPAGPGDDGRTGGRGVAVGTGGAGGRGV